MSTERPVPEYENEPVPGLPEELPEGEEILWQGAPSWRALARRAFHTRAVGLYFAVLVAWRVGAALSEGASFPAAVGSGVPLVLLASACVALLTGLAWLNARATVYTITSRRVVVRYGVAVPIAVNFPFPAIRSVELAVHADGTGDVPLAVEGVQQLGFLMLWPHARPWHFGGNAQPMLRAIPDARAVALRLSRAVGADTGLRAGPRRAPAATSAPPATDLASPPIAAAGR